MDHRLNTILATDFDYPPEETPPYDATEEIRGWAVDAEFACEEAARYGDEALAKEYAKVVGYLCWLHERRRRHVRPEIERDPGDDPKNYRMTA